MNNTNNFVDACLLAVGTAAGLANIEHILGIIILVIQLLWIFLKLIVKVIDALKHEESLESLDDDVGSVVDNLSDIKDALSSPDKVDGN